MTDKNEHRVVVMMGVAASGKTAVGEAVAERLDWPFQEGDDLHPAANVEKMRSGQPLTDADRAPWLDAVAHWISGRLRDGSGIVSCSALKRAYRDRLRQAGRGVRFVLLQPDADTLRERIEGRHHHFMPAALLDSQLATLEPPQADEDILVISDDCPIEDHVETICAWLDREDG